MSLLLGVPFRSVVRRPFTIRSRAAHTYFQYVNDNTGVYGRKINFKYLDDAYNPAQMIPLTKQPVEQDQVFAMYSGLGTEPQTAVRDYLNGPRVPQVFVASGAATFQADFNKYPYTFSAIPASQGEALICAGHLLQQNPGRRHLTE